MLLAELFETINVNPTVNVIHDEDDSMSDHTSDEDRVIFRNVQNSLRANYAEEPL